MTESVINRNSLYGFEIREPDLRRTDTRNSHDIKQLWQRSHEIISLALQGHTGENIAKSLGITSQTVSNTLNSELGMQKLSKMRQERDKDSVDVSKEISKLAEKALKIYEEILDDESGNVSLKLKKETADTVTMDLGGHRAPTKIESKSLSVTATAEEIEEFKQRGLDAARDAGMLADLNNPRKLLNPQDCLIPERTEA